MNFADRLTDLMKHKQTQLCLGLDPRVEALPPSLVERYRGAAGAEEGSGEQDAADCFEEFCVDIIEAAGRHVAAVKVQLACFEQYGPAGMQAFRNVCRRAAQYGLPVIADAKRGDIGISAEAYSAAFIGRPQPLTGRVSGYAVDALTVNPFFGSDGVAPFINDCQAFGKGLFILAKTSNPGSDEFQSYSGGSEKPLFEVIAEQINKWGEGQIGKNGYSNIGAVVGATDVESLLRARQLLPRAILLLPGFGSQGARASDVMGALGFDRVGAIVTASRSIIYAGSGADYAAAAAEAARKMKEELWKISH
ncbi:MAG: orotidine-5'-phosphate decarboxylase [Thermoleophilia bacterium]